jgi:hypothetical protein
MLVMFKQYKAKYVHEWSMKIVGTDFNVQQAAFVTVTRMLRFCLFLGTEFLLRR